MIRAQIIRLPEDQELVTLSLHHALSDGISMSIFAREVYGSYSCFPNTAISHGDYAALTAAADNSLHTEQCTYWKTWLAGIDEIPTLPIDMNADLPRQEKPLITRAVPYPRLAASAHGMGVTPFVMMAALCQIALGRASGRDKMVLTFQSAGRSRLGEKRDVIGPFSNTVILRSDLDDDQHFSAFAQRQKTSIRHAIANEGCPYHRVIELTGVRPSFGINWFPPQPIPKIEDVKVLGQEFIYLEVDFDLDFRFVIKGDILTILAIHDPGRHSRERVEMVLDDVLAALEIVMKRPDTRLDAIFPAPPPLTAFAPRSLPEGRLYDAVLAQARKCPDRVALLAHGLEITYGELEARSRLLARRLVADGLGSGSRVAILAERGPELVWSMLAVLQIGATMVPLDSEYPSSRLAVLVKTAKPDALLTPRVGQLPEWADGIPRHHAVVDFGAAHPSLDAVPEESLAAGDPDAPAYILFTSGSTGRPKAVATSHRPALNFLRWQRNTFRITAADRFTNLNGVAHDMMIRDIFAPLSVGGQLVIPRQEDIYTPGRLLELVLATQPTILHLTPAMGRLLAAPRKPGHTLQARALFFGGDQLLPDLTREIAELAPDAQIVNFYGATETPQAAAFHVCVPDRRWRCHPVGRGIENMTLRIVDANGRPVPQGVEGEIAVLSSFLSLGYVYEGKLQLHKAPNCYHTGDMGFELPGGDIMLTGRQDDQVSIRGFRVELNEITCALNDHPGVEAAQVLHDAGNRASPLVAFVAGHELNSDGLFIWLSRHLPDYMVPRDILVMSSLPLLPNGKVDRQRLLALPRRPVSAQGNSRAPTKTEKEIIDIWSRALGVAEISPQQSFAQLRGDSLSYVEILLGTEALIGELPGGWETVPISDLASLGPARDGREEIELRGRARWYKWVDSALIVRAIAIISVVMFHYRTVYLSGGGTTALFMVSGFFLGRFQLQEAFRSNDPQPILKLIVRILQPTILFIAIIATLLAGRGIEMDPRIYLFLADFIALDSVAEADRAGVSEFYLWYICCMIHMLLAVALATALNSKFHFFKKGLSLVCGLLIAGLFLRFVMPALVAPEVFVNGVTHGTRLAVMPSTHLATLMLGALLAFVSTRYQRMLALIFVFAYSAASYMFIEGHGAPLMLIFGVLALYMPKLPIPLGLHRVILMVSGSSLFIYLTHQRFRWELFAYGLPKNVAFQVSAAVCFGVVVWLLWNRLRAAVSRGVSKVRPRSIDPEELA